MIEAVEGLIMGDSVDVMIQELSERPCACRWMEDQTLATASHQPQMEAIQD